MSGPAPRCADAARRRGDSLVATAGPARRLLLLEVDGPWGRNALQDSRFDGYHAGRLADTAERAGVRVLLVRRPGRHAVDPDGGPRARAVALVRLGAGQPAVQWSTWIEPREVLDVDLAGPVVPQGPQEVALVCTHGRHDVCCALRGRPIAAALATVPGWDVWECSHVGGDRFAGNVVLLPDGDVFGGLDERAALAVLQEYDGGRLVAAQHRGRFGEPPAVQAAVHHARELLDDDRRGAVVATGVTAAGPDRWDVDIEHGRTRYRATVLAGWSPPELLTCHAGAPSRSRTWTVTGWHAA